MRNELKVAPGESVSAWIKRQPKRAVLRALRSLIHEGAPHLQERVKWSNPWYVGNDNVVYLASQQSYATFGVCNGAHLDDRHGLLEGTGKAMRHVKVRRLDNRLRVQLCDLLAEAIAFDQTNRDA